MRLSFDGEPCPSIVKTGSIPQGCEGYSKTPQMIEQEKKGSNIPTILGSGLILIGATFLGYMLLFSRRKF